MVSQGAVSCAPRSPIEPGPPAPLPRCIRTNPSLAVEMTRTSSCALEFWPVLDPSLTDGSREVRFVAYRALREDLLRRLRQRFPPRGAPVVGRVNHTGVALVKDQMPKIGALMRLVSR